MCPSHIALYLARMTRFRMLLALAAIALATPRQGIAQALVPPTRSEVVASDGHRLVLWSRMPAGTPRGEIVLLHGRTWSALPNFDLQVSGQRVSLMEALAQRGYAVYALDQRGYGDTRRDPTGWLTPERAARDADDVTDWVAARAPARRRPALFGYSRGSATAMLAAQEHPAKVSALILYGFYLDVDQPPAIAAAPSSPLREHTTATGAAEDFITPESTPRGVKEAYVKAALAHDPVRVDWRGEEQFNVLDPLRLHVPTLVINGESDPYAAGAGLSRFVGRLAGVDHSWVVLAKADHVAHLERQPAFADAIVSFLRQPR